MIRENKHRNGGQSETQNRLHGGRYLPEKRDDVIKVEGPRDWPPPREREMDSS
jgi:hypothetical protein